ncbi:hypothetical protein CHUAL_004874 [Chamberlinius hualienensis]
MSSNMIVLLVVISFIEMNLSQEYGTALIEITVITADIFQCNVNCIANVNCVAITIPTTSQSENRYCKLHRFATNEDNADAYSVLTENDKTLLITREPFNDHSRIIHASVVNRMYFNPTSTTTSSTPATSIPITSTDKTKAVVDVAYSSGCSAMDEMATDDKYIFFWAPTADGSRTSMVTVTTKTDITKNLQKFKVHDIFTDIYEYNVVDCAFSLNGYLYLRRGKLNTPRIRCYMGLFIEIRESS